MDDHLPEFLVVARRPRRCLPGAEIPHGNIDAFSGAQAQILSLHFPGAVRGARVAPRTAPLSSVVSF